MILALIVSIVRGAQRRVMWPVPGGAAACARVIKSFYDDVVVTLAERILWSRLTREMLERDTPTVLRIILRCCLCIIL